MLTMEQNITSNWTYFYKIILPIAFIPWAGFSRMKSAFPPTDPHSHVMFWVFIGAWILIGGWVFWFAYRLKIVKMDNKYLYVSNLLKVIRIPISDIAKIKESTWSRTNHVVLTLKSPSEFGSKIVFIPKKRYETITGKESVMESIKEMAGLAES